LILLGRKQYEIRSWQPNHRGRIWIHAGKTFDPQNVALAGLAIQNLPRGTLVGVVEIAGCEPFTPEIAEQMRTAGAFFGQWMADLYAWRLSNPKRLAISIPCNGKLKLFSLPSDLEALAETTPLL